MGLLPWVLGETTAPDYGRDMPSQWVTASLGLQPREHPLGEGEGKTTLVNEVFPPNHHHIHLTAASVPLSSTHFVPSSAQDKKVATSPSYPEETEVVS